MDKKIFFLPYFSVSQKKFGIRHEKKLDYNTHNFCCIHNTCMDTQICKLKVNFACGKYNQAHLLAIYCLCHWLPSAKEETFALIICLRFWAFGSLNVPAPGYLPCKICLFWRLTPGLGGGEGLLQLTDA